MSLDDLTRIGVPQDIIDQAKKVEMDAATLAKLCVDHTKEAVRDMLGWFAQKLGK